MTSNLIENPNVSFKNKTGTGSLSVFNQGQVNTGDVMGIEQITHYIYDGEQLTDRGSKFSYFNNLKRQLI